MLAWPLPFVLLACLSYCTTAATASHLLGHHSKPPHGKQDGTEHAVPAAVVAPVSPPAPHSHEKEPKKEVESPKSKRAWIHQEGLPDLYTAERPIVYPVPHYMHLPVQQTTWTTGPHVYNMNLALPGGPEQVQLQELSKNLLMTAIQIYKFTLTQFPTYSTPSADKFDVLVSRLTRDASNLHYTLRKKRRARRSAPAAAGPPKAHHDKDAPIKAHTPHSHHESTDDVKNSRRQRQFMSYQVPPQMSQQAGSVVQHTSSHVVQQPAVYGPHQPPQLQQTSVHVQHQPLYSHASLPLMTAPMMCPPIVPCPCLAPMMQAPLPPPSPPHPTMTYASITPLVATLDQLTAYLSTYSPYSQHNPHYYMPAPAGLSSHQHQSIHTQTPYGSQQTDIHQYQPGAPAVQPAAHIASYSYNAPAVPVNPYAPVATVHTSAAVAAAPGGSSHSVHVSTSHTEPDSAAPGAYPSAFYLMPGTGVAQHPLEFHPESRVANIHGNIVQYPAFVKDPVHGSVTIFKRQLEAKKKRALAALDRKSDNQRSKRKPDIKAPPHRHSVDLPAVPKAVADDSTIRVKRVKRIVKPAGAAAPAAEWNFRERRDYVTENDASKNKASVFRNFDSDFQGKGRL